MVDVSINNLVVLDVDVDEDGTILSGVWERNGKFLTIEELECLNDLLKGEDL